MREGERIAHHVPVHKQRGGHMLWQKSSLSGSQLIGRPIIASMPSREDVGHLSTARARAQSLLDDLLRQQAELDAAPPALSAAQLELGRLHLSKAVDAARRLLHSIDQALARAQKP